MYSGFVSERAKRLRRRLRAKFNSARGSNVVRVWVALQACWPKALLLRTLLDDARPPARKGSYKWSDIKTLCVLIDRTVEQWQRSPLSYSGAVKEQTEALCDIGDALHWLLDQLPRPPKRPVRSGIGVCRLCARLGRSYRSGRAYCGEHAPESNNSEYRAALRYMPLVGRYLDYFRRHTAAFSSLAWDEASLHAHRCLFLASDREVESAVNMLTEVRVCPFPWPRVRVLGAQLRAQSLHLETLSSSDIFELLWPEDLDNTGRWHSIRALHLRDERWLVIFAVTTEAFLRARRKRCLRHGGARPGSGRRRTEQLSSR